MIEHALLRQRGDRRGLDRCHLVGGESADSLSRTNGRSEHGVDLQLGPGRKVRRQRQHDGGRVLDRRGLERLCADQHADIEQDRRDRDHRHQRQQHRDDAEPGQQHHHDAGRGRIADPSAHRLPTGMADINRVDEGVAHQAADQADDAVGGQHACGRIFVAGGFRALDVVHGFDEVVDAERDCRHQDDAKELEAGEHLTDGRDRHREAEARKGVTNALDAQTAEPKAEDVRAPRDDHADRDRDKPRWNALRIFHAAKPAHQDDGKTDQPNLRRHVHLERRAHRDEGHGHTGERAKQRGARRDLADIRRDKAADHQNEALEEHPDQACRPALHGIAGLDRDRQHDHEGDDEHMRHADTRGQRANIAAAGFLRQPIGEPRIIEGREAHHQAEGGEDTAEHQ